MRRPALAVFGTGGAVACAARGGLQGRRPRNLRGRPGGGSSARLDPVGGAARTRRQQPTGPRSVFRASHLPLLRSAAAGSCSPPPPASSSPSSAELLPAPANRQQRLASGWGESVRPPPMGGGVTSPDVGGRNGGRRWSGYGESCSPNVGGAVCGEPLEEALARPLLINLQPRKKEKKKKRKRGRSCTCKSKGFYLLLVTFATLIYVLSDSFNFGHFHACMHEGLLLLQRFTPRLCSVPPNFSNFVSHQNHIEILNIANNACMKH